MPEGPAAIADRGLCPFRLPDGLTVRSKPFIGADVRLAGYLSEVALEIGDLVGLLVAWDADV